MRAVAGAVGACLSVSSAAAHSILYFDHAVPAVGSTVSKDSVREIALYFSESYDSAEFYIGLQCSGMPIRLTMVASENQPFVVAKTKGKVPAGTCYVSWRPKDESWENRYPFIAD